MLSVDENKLLTQVGRGTPMGELLRQYWTPFLFSSEIEAAGRPLRVKLMGEDLLAFGDAAGRPGLVEEHCAHRSTSLFFARSEDGGLRCVYHGWMYDASGQCIDMPNEPAASNFKDKVHLVSYPCQERNGIIWTYLGPREVPPPLPDVEWNMVPQENVVIWKNFQASNWVQGLEGNIDSSHLSFLHTRLERDGNAGFNGGGGRGLWYEDPAPRMEVMDTDYGVMYGCGRREEPGKIYWRVTQFMMPFYGLFAPIGPAECPMQWWVPLDDHNVMKWDVRWNPVRALGDEERGRLHGDEFGGYIEPTSDPYTHWRLAGNLGNDYFADWDAQKDQRFSAVPSVNLQDAAVQDSMGSIVNRTREHLGTADAMVIRTRKRLIAAAVALRDHGITPPGVDEPSTYGVRSATVVLDEGENWLEAARESLKAFTDLPVLSAEFQMRAQPR